MGMYHQVIIEIIAHMVIAAHAHVHVPTREIEYKTLTECVE